MKKTNNNKGFTLVELIIVIAIIGILAAVLIPTIGGYIEKAHRGRDVELAGNMTRDVSLYATEYDVEIDELTGVDVRTILLFKNYDLVPRRDKWVFVYDKTTNQVVVKDINKGGTISLAPEVPEIPIDPTHIEENYFLISKGKNSIEKAVNLMVNLRTDEDYDEASGMTPEKYKEVIETFNPTQTLFIDNAGGYTTATGNVLNIVVLELTSSLPKLTSDIESKFDKLDYNKSYPKTVRTSQQPDSKLKPLFSAAKVIDLTKIYKIDLPAFGIGNELYENKKAIYKLELEKYLTESFKQTVTDEVIGIIKYYEDGNEDGNEDGYIVKRQITVSYFNEKGLFAQGSIIYAVLERTT